MESLNGYIGSILAGSILGIILGSLVVFAIIRWLDNRTDDAKIDANIKFLRELKEKRKIERERESDVE